MVQLFTGRVGKRYVLYPPKELLEAIGVKEGDLILYRIEDGRLVVEPVINPFEYALKVKKWAKTSLKEIEEFSSKMQAEIIEKG
ncbi:MAG: AbrB/MazE/SpoVT family DNA-binding domain-containing protein [Thermoprotei archaeon]|nr:MAG: AbrB/MazE/SpoVT family DNA-binding domain-containing protein [Thermoprotei archaeon]